MTNFSTLCRVALCLVLWPAFSNSALAQHWADRAQENLLGQRYGLRSVDCGLRLPTPRYGMPAVVIDENIYVIGGSTPNGFRGDVIKINPEKQAITTLTETLLPRRYQRFDTRTSTVKKLAPLPTPLRLPGAVTVGTNIYVIGGSDRTGKYAGTVAIYNTENDTWSEGAPMPAPRECSFVVRDNKIYAVGGFNGVEAMTNFDVYDVATNSWTSLPPLPFTLSAHHIALLNGRIYAFGDFTVPERGAVYDFRERRWGPLLNTGFVSSRNNPVVELKGTLYVVGGNTNAAGTTLDLIQSFVTQ
jgi:hypothetical protein